MTADHRREIDVGQRVAVDEDERPRLRRWAASARQACLRGSAASVRHAMSVDEQRQRVTRAAGRPEHRRFPRVADARAQIAAVADGAAAIDSGRWCRLRTRSRTPCPTSQRIVLRARDSPSTGAAALARAIVSGWSRVPSPAVSTSAAHYSGEKTMSGPAMPARLAQLQEAGPGRSRGRSRPGLARAARPST